MMRRRRGQFGRAEKSRSSRSQIKNESQRVCHRGIDCVSSRFGVRQSVRHKSEDRLGCCLVVYLQKLCAVSLSDALPPSRHLRRPGRHYKSTSSSPVNPHQIFPKAQKKNLDLHHNLSKFFLHPKHIAKMSEHNYKFNVAMSCGGCSGAVERVLKKLDGESIAPPLSAVLLARPWQRKSGP
jgi:hypothetical protein